MLTLIDGHRTVADLVLLSGTGEYVVISSLASLASRGLITLSDSADGVNPVVQRQQLLAALEGRPRRRSPRCRSSRRAPAAERQPVIPERAEPFVPERQPVYAEEVAPAVARAAAAKTEFAPAASASSPAAAASGG